MGFMGDDEQASQLLSSTTCCSALWSLPPLRATEVELPPFLCSRSKQLASQASAVSFAWRLQKRRPLTDCQRGGYRPCGACARHVAGGGLPHARPHPNALGPQNACTRKLDTRAVHPPGKRLSAGEALGRVALRNSPHPDRLPLVRCSLCK